MTAWLVRLVDHAHRWRTGLVVVIVVGVVVAAAVFFRDDSTESRSRTVGQREPETTPSVESHPFAVASIPDGYRLVTAGRGTDAQAWGDDILGTDEPFTVLQGDGDALMIASATGYEGYQGGLDQASFGYVSDRESHSLEVDGRRAIFMTASEEYRSDLVVDHGNDAAVRLASADASEEEMVELARRVRPAAGRGEAPVVDDPPAPWRVIGTVDADAVMALDPQVMAEATEVPGPGSAHSAGWLSDRGFLAVMTLPGTAADLDALLYTRWPRGTENLPGRVLDIDGRTAVALERCVCTESETCACDEWSTRTRILATTDESGALVVAVAQGTAVPTISELVDVAASVTTAGSKEWEQFVIEATGGPGLHPDPGETELARGRQGDVDWLLQTVHTPGVIQPADLNAAVEADRCLKLSNRKRVCAETGGGSAGEKIGTFNGEPPEATTGEFPSFVIVTTQVSGATLRIQTETATVSGDLYPLPDSAGWSGVVFVDDPGLPTCGPPQETSVTLMRVEVLDAQGEMVDCIGYG